METKKGAGLYLLTATWAKPASSSNDTRLIQFALDVTQEELLIADYRRKMAAVLLIGLVLASAGGIVVARKGLQPLDEITRAVAGVRAIRLNERVGQRPWPKELATLAAVFDEMLGRLEESFARLSQFSADLAHIPYSDQQHDG